MGIAEKNGNGKNAIKNLKLKIKKNFFFKKKESLIPLSPSLHTQVPPKSCLLESVASPPSRGSFSSPYHSPETSLLWSPIS